MGGRIRRARAGEAASLSALALRAKAHWGYDDAFLAACREELTVPEAAIAAGEVSVHDDAGAAGYLWLRIAGGVAEVEHLFVAPERIGSGIGRALWAQAEAAARRRGIAELRLTADPFAEGFYGAMGCVPIGSEPSASVAGRLLPRLARRLDRCGG